MGLTAEMRAVPRRNERAHVANGTSRRWAAPLWAATTLLLAAVGAVVGAPSAFAQASATQQWVTSIAPAGTQTVGGTGLSQTFAFGTTGVTASLSSRLTAGSGVVDQTPEGPIDTATGTPSNIDQFLEPTPPAGSASEVLTTFAGQTEQNTITFNRPVVDPVVHFVNLNLVEATVGGTSTTGASIGITTLAKNNVMTVSGNTIDTTEAGGPNGGCENNNGTNVAGRCGSFQLTAASGEIQSFTLSFVSSVSPDGWAWTLSYPTAPLTKAFSPSNVSVSGVSQLTFSVSNPNNPGQPAALSPLNFTDAFPSGLFLADTTTSNNGDCGSPSVTDSSGNGLVAGDTGVTASNISVALGQTCFITVDVSSPVPATYTNDDTNLSSTLGTVDPDTTTTLTVSPAVSTPLLDPWVAGPAVLALGLIGAAYVVTRRRRASAA